ncbi:MAG: hypothetical protein WC429_23530, partial [Verrucomicrobiia bacterium]
MLQNQPQTAISRRTLLGAAAAGLTAMAGSAGAAEPEAASHGKSKRNTVRDRFWIFTVYAGGDNDYLERANVRGG